MWPFISSSVIEATIRAVCGLDGDSSHSSTSVPFKMRRSKSSSYNCYKFAFFYAAFECFLSEKLKGF